MIIIPDTDDLVSVTVQSLTFGHRGVRCPRPIRAVSRGTIVPNSGSFYIGQFGQFSTDPFYLTLTW